VTQNHSAVRFIGYPIPTTPSQVIPIGNPNGPGAVAGTYLAAPSFSQDVAIRIAVLKNAVDTARAALPKDPAGAVTNVFVAPEFFFHGLQGPYIYGPQEQDPVATLLEALVAAFPPSDYPDWTFVFGSAISARIDAPERVFGTNSVTVRNAVVETLSQQWQASFGPLQAVIFDMLVNFIKNCHAYPAVEVRNRALLVSGIPLSTPAKQLDVDNMTTEKYYDSNEDFILYDVAGKKNVVTEQMTAYPQIDLTAGDLKHSPYDKYAIFRQNYGATDFPRYVDFGLEICLDHSDFRLRRNIDNEPFPKSGDAVHVQLIPSCGMQIILQGVATDANGLVFNCDGQYALDSSVGQPQAGVQSGVQCIYANYVDPKPVDPRYSKYAGHTQLARVATPAVGDDPNAPGSKNATFDKLSASDVTVLAVKPIKDLDTCFAGGPGELHVYGMSKPYTLYP